MKLFNLNTSLFISMAVIMSQPLFCQQTEKLIQPTPFSTSGYATHIDGALYLEQQEFTTLSSNLPHSIKIVKLDLGLNVLDSINLNNVLGLGANLFGVIAVEPIGVDSLLILSLTNSLVSGQVFSDTYGIITSNNLTVLDTFRIKPFNHSHGCSIFGVYKDGQTLLVCGTKTPYLSLTDGYVAEIDFSGNILNEIILPHTLSGISSPVLTAMDIVRSNNVIIVSLEEYGLSFSIARIDSFTTITPIVFGPASGLLLPFVQLAALPNKPPLVYAIASFSTFPRPKDPTRDGYFEYLSLLTLDSTFSLSRQDTFQYTWDNIIPKQGNFIPQTYLGTIDYYQNPDSTIFGASDLYSPGSNLGSRAINKTYLHSVNAQTGTPNWHKVYSNGYSHNLVEVVALPGNRTLLVFSENDWNRLGYNNLAIRLIIIDGNGNPIGVPEAEQQILQLALQAYPNPAQNEVHIAGLPENGSFTYYLTNALGQAVQQGTLSANQNILQLGSLPSGTYSLTVVNQYGFGQATKIVKH